MIDRTESVCHVPNDLGSIGEIDKCQMPLRTSMPSSLAGKPVAQGAKSSLSWYELFVVKCYRALKVFELENNSERSGH